MTGRPHIQNLLIWNCDVVEIKRDAENDCFDIICRGTPQYATMRITLWNTEGKTPVLKIDQDVIDPPTTKATITDILNESLTRDAFIHSEDMGEGGE